MRILITILMLMICGISHAAINCVVNSPDVIPLPVQVANAPVPNSRVNPQINVRHIFCGEINAANNAVGYHSRPGGHDATLGNSPTSPRQARITGGVQYVVLPGRNNPGPYRYIGGGIQVYDSNTGNWVLKGGSSTFFPDNCSKDEIIASIRYAYTHLYNISGPVGNQRFSGPSAPDRDTNGYCHGGQNNIFTISGYLNLIGGLWRLNSAFPAAAF